MDVLLALIDTGKPCLLIGDLNATSPSDVETARPESWVERYRARQLDDVGSIDVRAIAWQ